MADIFTKKKRSEVMSRIRSTGNKDTELKLAGVLRAMKIKGWRRHVAIKALGSSRRKEAQISSGMNAAEKKVRASSRRLLPLKVRPDFVFAKQRLAVFVDGCFWHGCPRHGTKPKGNAAFWKKKLERNRARDREVNRALRRAGWRVMRIWEHELARKYEARLAARLRRAGFGGL